MYLFLKILSQNNVKVATLLVETAFCNEKKIFAENKLVKRYVQFVTDNMVETKN